MLRCALRNALTLFLQRQVILLAATIMWRRITAELLMAARWVLILCGLLKSWWKLMATRWWTICDDLFLLISHKWLGFKATGAWPENIGKRCMERGTSGVKFKFPSLPIKKTSETGNFLLPKWSLYVFCAPPDVASTHVRPKKSNQGAGSSVGRAVGF